MEATGTPELKVDCEQPSDGGERRAWRIIDEERSESKRESFTWLSMFLSSIQ